MELISPTREHKQAAWDYRQEHIDCGEAYIHGSSGFIRAENYESWLEKILWNQTNATSDWVTGNVYFAFIADRIVGTIAVRHSLNDSLLKFGGHIGYGIRPSERRKGYGAEMLALALEKCREFGIEKALVTCDKDNIASAKTALRNGGILENEFVEDVGNIVQRYWIMLDGIHEVSPIQFNLAAEVIRASFATVAAEFGLNKQNCPNHTSFIMTEQLQKHFKSGWLMYGLYEAGRLIGYVSLSKENGKVFELHNLAVLPEYRHKSYGKRLIDFCKKQVKERNGDKITIGIIEENSVLKNWYAANGFIHTGTKIFSHLPFTVGFMELSL